MFSRSHETPRRSRPRDTLLPLTINAGSYFKLGWRSWFKAHQGNRVIGVLLVRGDRAEYGRKLYFEVIELIHFVNKRKRNHWCVNPSRKYAIPTGTYGDYHHCRTQHHSETPVYADVCVLGNYDVLMLHSSCSTEKKPTLAMNSFSDCLRLFCSVQEIAAHCD